MSRTRIIPTLALTVSAIYLWSIMGVSVRGSGPKSLRIRVVDYPRPIAAALLQIEKHFHSVVTYEDTRYIHPSDIVDVTERFGRDRSDPAKRLLGMRGGSIDLTYTPRPGTATEAQVAEVLQAVLAHSRNAWNTGEFRIDWIPGGYHVVPVAMKGKNGAMEPYASPLDARITLTYRQENGLDLMLRLVRAIAAASGSTVTVGTMPMNRLERARVAVDAHNDPARDVLWRGLQSIGPDLSWQLLCDVGEQGLCALNIHAVPRK